MNGIQLFTLGTITFINTIREWGIHYHFVQASDRKFERLVIETSYQIDCGSLNSPQNHESAEWAVKGIVRIENVN